MKYRKLILAQLRKDNPGVPERVLGLLADKIAPNVTADDQIEGAIAELVDNMPFTVKEFADFTQKEGDRRVTEATTKKPKEPKTTEEIVNAATGDDDEPTTEMGELKQLIKGLAQTVGGLVKEKTTSTIKTKMEAQLTEKKIPLFLLKGRVPEKEEEMDDILADIEADWGTQKQTASTSKLNSFRAPVNSSEVGGGDDDTIDPDVAAYTKRKLDAANLQSGK